MRGGGLTYFAGPRLIAIIGDPEFQYHAYTYKYYTIGAKIKIILRANMCPCNESLVMEYNQEPILMGVYKKFLLLYYNQLHYNTYKA